MKMGVRRAEPAAEQVLSEAAPEATAVQPHAVEVNHSTSIPTQLRHAITESLYSKMNMEAASKLTRVSLTRELERMISDLANEGRIQINSAEQRSLAEQVAYEMMGNGPIEILLHDDTVSDIMVNGPDKVWVERQGKAVLTDIKFRDEKQLRQLASRMAGYVNRRLDESSPMVDARLPDGSRVNIVIPPISLDGTTISIRRFPKLDFTFEILMRNGAISERMKAFLEIVSRCRLNILISGGTSSGKTTLLNAISRGIQNHERIITIEDSAELRLQQPHVVRLETRPRALEGAGEVTQRDLVKNALRMRPDRIILGEVRGSEAFDLLQAMNTGHEGSMGTLHSNAPRDALARLESMILMAGFELPTKAIRQQISSAVDIIVQVERMADGVRRVTAISEVTGMEGEMITMQDIFRFTVEENRGGRLIGEFGSSNVHLRCQDKIKRYGMNHEMRRILSAGG